MSSLGASVSDDAYHTVILILGIKVNTDALHGNTSHKWLTWSSSMVSTHSRSCGGPLGSAAKLQASPDPDLPP